MKDYQRRRLRRPTMMLAFSRGRIARFEELEGVRCALVAFRSAPDVVIGRDQVVSQATMTDLQTRYVVCANGVPATHRDATGAMFFAIPDAVVVAA